MFTGEEETGADTEAVDTESADTSSADESTDTEDNSEKKSDDGEGEASKDGENAEEDEDVEPPTRKPRTKADWVALRRKQKLDKERARKATDGQGEAEDDENEADDDLTDVSEEDRKVIEKVVEKKLAPLEQERYENQLKGEIDQFVAENPEFKPFAQKALKWAKHPTWRDIPTEQLMYAAAGKKLLQIGATRMKQAQDKADKSKTATGTGSSTSKKSVWDMTDDEFAKEVEAVKLGQ